MDQSPVDVAHRIQRAEFFRASSPTSLYVVRSETPYYQQQSPPNFTGAKATVSAATKGQGSNIQAAADFGILVWRERAIGGQIVGRIPSTIERATR